jgi:hypothetical protein
MLMIMMTKTTHTDRMFVAHKRTTTESWMANKWNNSARQALTMASSQESGRPSGNHRTVAQVLVRLRSLIIVRVWLRWAIWSKWWIFRRATETKSLKSSLRTWVASIILTKIRWSS